jgi:SIR2-like domain/Domain of unknown function (DUF4020)
VFIKGVNFPEIVLRAQRSGSLVIFAGAGVSIPAPSNLPNFDKLAERVADSTLRRGDGEPVDQFLGRLAVQGVKVHERVLKILTDPGSAPNSLHIDLLRLFGLPANVRLVTTNFDRHFTKAAETVFANTPEIHCAPALPLGNDFAGIVYLHGSVEAPARRLVLTDADFGRAYLTDGWARTFLQRLFATHVVVFVGYSHSDLVISYLARGLPPASGEPRRFAITEEGRDERWKYLGIVPISYALGGDEDKHAQVRIAITAWADLAGIGALEQEQKIKTIVEQEFPLAPEDADYIEEALHHSDTTRFFTRHAKALRWLKWVEGKGLLGPLFKTENLVGEPERELAWWFAEKFVCEHSGSALAVVQRQGSLLSPDLWFAIAHRLWTKKPEHDSRVFAQWIAVLTRSQPRSDGTRVLDYILNKLSFPDDEFSALYLFEYLSRPTLALKKNLWTEIETKGSNEDVDFELESEGDEYFFAETWRHFFQPRLALFADRLFPIITGHLLQAHLSLRVVGKADHTWDPLSFSRQSIESPPTVPHDHAVETLVDAARDIVKWYTENNSTRADSLIDIWSNSTCPILERLATFAVATSCTWTPDRKIEWVLRDDSLYTRGRKNEVFLLLKNSYPIAEQRVRSLLLERVVRGPDADPTERTHAYEIYNLLYWLHDSSPECPLAAAQFKAFAAKHPEFTPREHPELDVVFGPVRVGWASPMNAKELLSKSPEEQVDFLLSFEPHDPLGPDREGLTRSVSEAVSISYDWGLRLARALDIKPQQKEDLWRAIADGWVGTSFTEVQWKEIIEFLETHDRLINAAIREVSRMLEKAFDGSQHGIPDSLIPAATALAARLWEVCANFDEKPREKADDWYFLAINHPGGTLATLSLELVFRTRKRLPGQWIGIPSELRAILEPVVKGRSSAAELGRVILASRIHFLFGVDPTWTVEHILPLFDWSLGNRSALQAWHGYLSAGMWNDALLDHLMPLYEGMFPTLHAELGRFRQRFCEHLAWIACLSLKNPMREGWLQRFLQQVDTEERRMWASFVGEALKGMKEPARQSTWDNWIKDYWDRRLDGIPLPLDGQEVAAMISWLPYLGSALPDAVERVESSPLPDFGHSSFLYFELSESDVPVRYPTAVARLILRALQAGLNPHYDFEQFEDIFNRLVPGADRRTLVSVCYELAKLGYPGARKLRDSIGNEPQP